LKKLKTNKEVLEKFVELADTPEDAEKTISNAINTISQYNEDLGTYDEVKSSLEEAIELKEAVTGFGGIDEITSVFAIAEELCNEKEVQKEAKRIADLVSDTKLSEEKVKELLAKYDEADIRELCSVKSGTNENEAGTGGTKTVIVGDKNDNDLDEGCFIRKSRAERIAERFQSM